jgi:hypothetical protein
MAVYFLLIKIFSRAKGSRATQAAAYRAGERIHDERTTDSYNYSSRRDVAHKEIVLPSDIAEREDMNWARDRSELWNAAEHAGRRRNSRLAREVLVLLPPELNPAQRTRLVRGFSQELADRYRGAVDFAVHEPRAGSDERHHHAHILMTTRQVTAQGLGARTTLELSGTERHERGLGPSRDDLLFIRERWAQVANEALREGGVSARVDHRSYKDQGIDREPKPMMPLAVYYAEKKSGKSTPAGDNIRARYRERVEARLKGSEEHARVLRKQNEVARRRAIEDARRKAAQPKELARGALTRDELNQRDRERRRANAEEGNSKERERRRAQKAESLGLPSRSPTAEESVKKWLAYRESQNQSPTAEESLGKWLAYRESGTQSPTAEESLNKWLAYRAGQTQPGPSQPNSDERTHKEGSSGTDDDDDDRKKTDRSRDHDFGL